MQFPMPIVRFLQAVAFLSTRITASPSVLIYRDDGVADYVRDPAFLDDLRVTVKKFSVAPTALTFGFISADELLADGGAWRKSTRVLVMPGGADLPYCEKLDGLGTKLIREFVHDFGGGYVGFCAGAYFGCERCEFRLHNFAKHPIEGERELRFFPGAGVGPWLGNYVPTGETTARIGAVIAKASTSLPAKIKAYYNGGPAFLQDTDPGRDFEVLARYESKETADNIAGPALVRMQVGRGYIVKGLFRDRVRHET